MKLKWISLLTVISMLNILYSSSNLRYSPVKENFKKSGEISLMWAVGEKYRNINQRNQFFDQAESFSLIKDLSGPDEDYEKIWSSLTNSIFFSDQNYKGPHLDSNSDYTIRKIKIYNRDFLKYGHHEYLQFCVTNRLNDEFYFVIHRGAARLNTFEKFVDAIPTPETGPPILRTLVRVIYTGYKRNFYDGTGNAYNQENLCAESSEEWAENRGRRDNQETSDSNLLDSAGDSQNFLFREFKILIKGIINYVINFPEYDIFGTNCQHFATGVFNAITNRNKAISNPKISFIPESEKDLKNIFETITSE